MNRKIAAVAAIATVLVASACSSSGSSGDAKQATLSKDGKGKTVTVWLMDDAQKGWPSVVDAAKKQFEEETGATLKIEWQTWTNYTTKLDTALLSGNAPDLIEAGNTQTAKYIEAGSFVDLTGVKGQFDNSDKWLDSLAASGQSGDGTKTYAVPYYAGARVLIYRKDLFAAAGVTAAPTTLAELTAALDKVKAANASTPGFSALYLPGQNWYTAASFGAGTFGVKNIVAKKDGDKWAGTLTDPKFVEGIKTWNDLQKKYSTGGTTTDEATQDALMAKGNIAAIVGAGWELGSVIDPKTGDPKLADKLATIALPGTAAGSPTPAFLGGSDLAVPAKAANPGLGATFLQIYTNTKQQTELAKFAIPNNKTLVAAYKAAAPANKAAGDAAEGQTWFIPNSPLWSGADETALKTAFGAIAAGGDPAAELKKVQDTIVKDLNG
ncbi:sugar ABC transporter substrate-binding protein [Kitasatospora atroaurantiaca]|uniref:Carbohydrate ABC transporter substrate-binding protein (CUT1 family) n=1 Tax=Kitasatospora atroaurantiaca TaxID=285545 RepID=A0A561EV19_9ACTN|nr:extracellular solute-binding protein [Kitasatospora atroaurantiaca]TWE19431.1 carbohydrate ABC transporter substrate-binding protein (CUT1 family) [Kitasatospora atroaurantiaca]